MKSTSNFLKETEYHELSHASHYAKLGNTWYNSFVMAELAEILTNPSGALNPYGPGNTINSPIIALGEAWAYHMGHFLAEQRYGTLGSCHNEQVGGFNYCPNPPTNTAHPNIDVLEEFNPNLGTDPFNWIPKGLMQDLMDNGEALNTTVNDQVTGFTVIQIFNALQSDVTTVQQYRARFITQNPNPVTNPNQSTQIITLFASYHY